MTNETTPEETVSAINNLTAKIKSLPWKKIAIGTAAVTATAALVVFAKKLEDPAIELEIKEMTIDGVSVDLTSDTTD